LAALLDAAGGGDAVAPRDHAWVELLYARGVRVG
jgi:site-specific recombinase XerD